MTWRLARIVLSACSIVFIGAACVLAADWPQWRGPNRDGKLSDFKAPATWPAQLTQKWKAAVGAGDAIVIKGQDSLTAYSIE